MAELASPAVATGAPPGRFAEFWRSYTQSRGALIGLALVVLLVLLAIFADVVSPHPPNEQYREFTLTPARLSNCMRCRFPAVAASAKYRCRRSLNLGRLPTIAIDIINVLAKAITRVINAVPILRLL